MKGSRKGFVILEMCLIVPQTIAQLLRKKKESQPVTCNSGCWEMLTNGRQ